MLGLSQQYVIKYLSFAVVIARCYRASEKQSSGMAFVKEGSKLGFERVE